MSERVSERETVCVCVCVCVCARERKREREREAFKSELWSLEVNHFVVWLLVLTSTS